MPRPRCRTRGASNAKRPRAFSSRGRARALGLALAATWLAAGSAACSNAPPPAPPAIGVEIPAEPTVQGPLPTTAQSYPFNASQHDTTPIDLANPGYEEQEYLVSGPARVFDWPELNTLRVAATGSYTTRVLIRRPTEPSKFSGRIRVEPLNTTSGHDLDAEWEIEHQGFMRSGDAYVGITVGPATLASLKRFDPSRYGRLQLNDPQPDHTGCATSSQIDDSGELGLAWDIISQVGALLRSPAPSNPLRDLHPRTSTLTGWSQSASYDLTYLNAISRHVVLPSGGPVFDAYLPGAGGYAGTPISRCTPLPPPGDPRVRFNPPPGVALEAVSTPTDFATAGSFPRPTDRPEDSDTATRRVRLYEIGGGSHLPSDQGSYFPSDAELAQAGREPENRVAYPLSNFPLHAVLDGAFANLDAWVEHNVPPPRASRLAIANPGAWPVQAVTDAFGNPLGGVRTPAVDVPTATYAPRGLKAPGSTESAYAGHDIAFSSQYLTMLYPSHNDYVAKVTDDVHALQAQRWLTAADAEDLVQQASQSQIP